MSIAAPALIREFGITETQIGGGVFSLPLKLYRFHDSRRLAGGPTGTAPRIVLGRRRSRHSNRAHGDLRAERPWSGFGGARRVGLGAVPARFGYLADLPGVRAHQCELPAAALASPRPRDDLGWCRGWRGSRSFLYVALAKLWGWQGALLTAGAITVLLALVWRFTVFASVRNVSRPRQGGNGLRPFRNRGLLLLSVVFCGVLFRVHLLLLGL